MVSGKYVELKIRFPSELYLRLQMHAFTYQAFVGFLAPLTPAYCQHRKTYLPRLSSTSQIAYDNPRTGFGAKTSM